ncbi:maleylpyruvate isomerase family mycothiol-dependent enzyme [Phycicoccus sp.]|uniref:maleylpyruvate isomerase family mycothiol-dependent enzyme n=1 Tax=Phycicoccus sp. TaxID=1902410 RepID=UPI002C8A0046|nr:maleylpyruvate isomerase family mycothiol-dependent enzyme [Phycicoccus sp.]HMM94477.1 maleylpyruvate isomerase family mycothiol-dependent enzyme [Phycicoccus sp.]
MPASDLDPVPYLAAHTARLVATTRALDDASGPSLCEGWSRGHVASHVARNADGLVRLVRSAVDGTRETMYASRDRRNADIDAGAGRTPAELADDLERTAADLADELPRLRPEHAGHALERTPGDVRGSAADIPMMRLREVTWHHVDLDAGFGFADLEPELQLAFLDEEVERLRGVDAPPDLTLRSDEGDEWTLGVGTTSVTGSRAALLGWLARGLTDGVTGELLPRLPEGR